ncbi:hypothetical protein ACFLWS_04170, partial [Chloroflexota bacterium]
LILHILPILLLIVLYLFIFFTRRGEIQRVKVSFKGHDWLTFFATIFGTTVLTSAMSALGINAPPWALITIVMLFILSVFVVVVWRARGGKPILRRLGDERINLIYTKGARNALFATYLTFFVHILITDADTLDTMWLVITLAGGLAVLMVSIVFYYYRKA